ATKAKSRNWHAISPQELNITGQVGITYTFLDGVHDGIPPLPTTHGTALVLQGVIEDKKTLAIAFRGTDNPGDVLQWPTPDQYFATFLPLISALPEYIRKNSIQQVLVTGHSLGAAMVQDFLGFPLAGVSPSIVKGYTWGSPGGDTTPI